MLKSGNCQAAVNRTEREYDDEKELCPEQGQIQQPFVHPNADKTLDQQEAHDSSSFSPDILQREALTRSSSEPVPIPLVYSPMYDGAAFTSGNPDSNRWVITAPWENLRRRYSHRNINYHTMQESNPTMWQPTATSDPGQSYPRSESHSENTDATPSAPHTLSSPYRRMTSSIAASSGTATMQHSELGTPTQLSRGLATMPPQPLEEMFENLKGYLENLEHLMHQMRASLDQLSEEVKRMRLEDG